MAKASLPRSYRYFWRNEGSAVGVLIWQSVYDGFSAVVARERMQRDDWPSG